MENPKILIVDDLPKNLLIMEQIFEDIPCEIHASLSGREALGKMMKHDFAVVLLDVQMPDIDGFETAKLMRSNNKTRNVPIIFVTAINKEQAHVFEGYKSGAVDYLLKPFNPDILLSKVSVFLGMYKQKRGLEQMQEELLKQKKLLEELSIKDELTGLYNRRHLNAVLDQEIHRSQRYGTDLSCLMLDLDHFKKVNDSYGHGFGDTVLREFSCRVMATIRSSDYAFRFGGEEFLVLLPQTDIEGAKQTAKNIQLALAADEIKDSSHSIIITISIGGSSLHLHQPSTPEAFISCADKALYAAKEGGRNKIVVYDAAI